MIEELKKIYNLKDRYILCCYIDEGSCNKSCSNCNYAFLRPFDFDERKQINILQLFYDGFIVKLYKDKGLHLAELSNKTEIFKAPSLKDLLLMLLIELSDILDHDKVRAILESN